MKKLAITFASLLMMISMFFFSPDTVSAEENSGTCGENAQWSFDASTNTLTISGTGAMEVDLPYGDMPWEKFYGSIYYIVIEEGITHICDNAFEYSGPILDVTIPKSVTSIGASAFKGTALTHIELHDGITSLGRSAFDSSRLQEITIPAGVTELPNYLFSYCNDLKKVTLHNNITTIGADAFANCTSLYSIAIPDSVTVLKNNAFDSCTELYEITLGKGIKTIPKHCFSRCFSLQEISIPDKVTAIESEAFWHCSALDKITFGSGLKEVSANAFYACLNLKAFNISSKNRTFTTDEYGILYSKDKKTLCLFPAGFSGEYTVLEGTQKIQDAAALVCTNLTGIKLPDSVIEIGNRAFGNCPYLKNVDLGNGVQTIASYAFDNCDSLEVLIFPASLTSINSYTLQGCSNLQAVVFLGDRPQFGYDFHILNSPICWYPAENTTWKNNFPEHTLYPLNWRPLCTGDHVFIEEEGLAPTCTEKGHEAYMWCQNCGFFPKYPTSIPTLEHIFGEWVYTTPAGTPAAGHLVMHTCTLCGYSEGQYAVNVNPSELPDPPVLPPEDTSTSTEDSTTDNTESDPAVKDPVKIDTPTIIITITVIIAAILIGIVLRWMFKKEKSE